MSKGAIEQGRKRQIVDAAVGVIAEHGYHHASFVRIGQQAGVSPALISYHFRDKAHLMEQVFDAVLADIDGALEDRIGDAADHCVALTRLICAQIDYFKAHLTELVALGQIFDHGIEDPVLGPSLEHKHASWSVEIEKMLRAGQEAGDFAKFDVRPVALSLLASFEAFVAELHRNPDTDATAYGSTLAQLFDAATRADRRVGSQGCDSTS